MTNEKKTSYETTLRKGSNPSPPSNTVNRHPTPAPAKPKPPQNPPPTGKKR
jgi:hypothetical protein